MNLGDDNSLLSVVVVPVLAGAIGFALFGPLGLLGGATLALVVGANLPDETADREARIAELERRVDELESESER